MLTPLLLSLTAASPAPPQVGLPGHAVPSAPDGSVWRSDDAGNRHGVRVAGSAVDAKPQGAQRSVANAWSALGPFGGDVFDVSASPAATGFVLAAMAPAGAPGALYASNDGGSSWNEVPALGGIDCYDIEFTAAGTAYVGSTGGLWRSTDQGATWVNLPLGFGVNQQIFEVTLDPSNALRLWVGVADALGSQTANVVRSDDGGASWADVTPAAAAGQSARAIAVDPANPDRIAVGFGGGFSGGGLFVSDDGGSTWADRGAGLPSNPINDLEFDGARLLVCGGRAFGSQTFGLYQSTDAGLNWTALHDSSWPSLFINDIEVLASGGIIFLGSEGSGVFASYDSGSSWNFGAGGTDGFTVNEVSGDPQAGITTVFLGATSNAVYRSNNGGASFTPSSAGIAALNVYSVASNPNDPFEIAIAFQGQNNGGVYTTVDGGSRWTLQPLPGTRFETVKFDLSGELYAISDGPTTVGPEGLYRRSGGWVGLGPDQGPQFESELVGLAFSNSDPNLILAAGSDFGVAGSEPTIWRSGDQGSTWTKVFEGTQDFLDVMDIEIVQDGTDQTALACYRALDGSNAGGAMRSSDGGNTWTISNAGLPGPVRLESLSASPSSPSRFFVANQFSQTDGLFETTDGGQTWQSSGFTNPLFKVECSPTDPDVLYASSAAVPRIRRSTDGGATFTAYDAGASDAGFVRDLHVGATGEQLFAATTNGTWFTLAGETLGMAYCTPGVPNSTGRPSEISARGSSAASDNMLRLDVRWLPRQTFGYLITSLTQDTVPGAGGSQGTLCLGGSVGRFSQQAQQSGADGAFSLPVDLSAVPQPNGSVQVMAGQTWNFQCWHRDANPAVTSNFSNGISVTFN